MRSSCLEYWERKSQISIGTNAEYHVVRYLANVDLSRGVDDVNFNIWVVEQRLEPA